MLINSSTWKTNDSIFPFMVPLSLTQAQQEVMFCLSGAPLVFLLLPWHFFASCQDILLKLSTKDFLNIYRYAKSPSVCVNDSCHEIEDWWGELLCLCFFLCYLTKAGGKGYYCGTWACNDTDPLRMWTCDLDLHLSHPNAASSHFWSHPTAHSHTLKPGYEKWLSALCQVRTSDDCQPSLGRLSFLQSLLNGAMSDPPSFNPHL